MEVLFRCITVWPVGWPYDKPFEFWYLTRVIQSVICNWKPKKFRAWAFASHLFHFAARHSLLSIHSKPLKSLSNIILLRVDGLRYKFENFNQRSTFLYRRLGIWQYIDRISISMASMSQKIHKSILKVEASHIRVSKIAKCKFFRTKQIQYRQKWHLLMTRAR